MTPPRPTNRFGDGRKAFALKSRAKEECLMIWPIRRRFLLKLPQTTENKIIDLPQSRSEESLQKCCHLGQHTSWSPALLFCSPSGERDSANHGSSHLGSEDGRDQFNHLEERSRVRSPTITATSSLSISEQGFSISAVYSLGGRSGSADARFEGE